MTQPLIKAVPPTKDQERVDAIFAQVEEHLGFVPEPLKLYAISPPLLEAFVANVNYFRGGTSLPPVLTSMIRYLVSERAGCQFCIDLNEGFLDSLGVDLEQARAATKDPDKAPLEMREKHLMQIALQAVDSARTVDEAAITEARTLGWSDREIFDAVAQAASNRALNHVLGAFRVESQGALV